MEVNQNEKYGEDALHTYGEESRIYENASAQGNQQYGSGDGPASGNPYGHQNDPFANPYNRSPYGNGHPPYGNGYGIPPYGNSYGMPQHGQVTDTFCYIVLVIMVIRLILSFFAISRTYAYMDTYWQGNYLRAVADQSIPLLSVASTLLFIAYVAFVAIDIVKIQKADYKIVGLILFAFFLNAGYYIWRAYILGRKKAGPIVFTVVYSLILLGSIIYSFYESFSWMLGHMRMFY